MTAISLAHKAGCIGHAKPNATVCSSTQYARTSVFKPAPGDDTAYWMSRSHGEFAKSSVVVCLCYLSTSDTSPTTSCLLSLRLHPGAIWEAPPEDEEGREQVDDEAL
jgi:hypothetical protein